MKKTILLLLVLFGFSYGSTPTHSEIDKQPYVASTHKHLYKKFDYFSDTDTMECNSLQNPTICTFHAKHDSNFGMILLVLLIAFIIIVGLIGNNGDGSDYDPTGGY